MSHFTLTVRVHMVVLVGPNPLDALGLCMTTRSGAMMDVHVTRGGRKSTIVLCWCARTPFTTTDNGWTPGSRMSSGV